MATHRRGRAARALISFLLLPALAGPLAATAAAAPPPAAVAPAPQGLGVPRPGVVSDPVDAYITQVYLDLFDRAPDAEGLAGWGAALRGGAPFGVVSNGITGSREFRASLVTEAYKHFLGRQPDAAGLESWIRVLGGVDILQVEAGFIDSPEYYAAAGGTDTKWVKAIYWDLLDRAPSDAEVAHWTALRAAQGRRAVSYGLLYSAEHLGTIVDGYYEWLLGRSLDDDGRASWVAALQNGYRTEQIIAGIIASAEYRANVGH